MKGTPTLPARPAFPFPLWADRVGAEITLFACDEQELLLRWVEPGRCHYGEQRWLLISAKHSGRCILSGLPIRRGDLVFRPAGRPMPANADKMMLRGQLELALSGETVVAS
jgi:hypothetical protein